MVEADNPRAGTACRPMKVQLRGKTIIKKRLFSYFINGRDTRYESEV